LFLAQQGLYVHLKNLKFEVLGGGTNVLLNKTIDFVICLTSMPRYLHLGREVNVVSVSANYPTNSLILNAIASGIKNLEELIGIPGTLGGAIVMNAGSKDSTISDYLLTVTTLDCSGNLHLYTKNELKFKRRYSILQDKKEIIIDTWFNFETGDIDDKKRKVKVTRKE